MERVAMRLFPNFFGIFVIIHAANSYKGLICFPGVYMYGYKKNLYAENRINTAEIIKYGLI